MTLPEQIEQVKNRIVNALHPKYIILFGSQAQGTATAHSDIDLLVVADVFGKRREVMDGLYAAVREFRLPIELVLLTPEEYEVDRYIPGTIARPAWKEGKVLYGTGH